MKKIILESKKEESRERLIKLFPDQIKYIDAALNSDPTGYKYIPWIEYQYKNFVNEEDQDFYLPGLNLLIDTIKSFHEHQNKLSVRLIDNFIDNVGNIGTKNISGIRKNPKDIMAYKDVRDLNNILEIAKNFKSQSEKEKEAKKNVNKIYEDNHYLVVQPLSHMSSCYYGANTKWCTTSEETDMNFKKYSRDGELFYFIDKRNELGKVAIHIPHALEEPITGWNEEDEKINLSYFESNYKDIKPVIDKLFENKKRINLQDLLVKYREGKINKGILFSSDPSIIDVSKNGNNELFIVIEFNYGNSYFDLLPFDNEINNSFTNLIYHNDRIYDFTKAEYDYDNGIIFSLLSDDNRNKLIELTEKTTMKFSSCFEFTSDSCYPQLADYLDNQYDIYMSNLRRNYFAIINNDIKKQLIKKLTIHYCDNFEHYGLISETCFKRYHIKVEDLILLYEKTGDKRNTIKQLLQSLNEDTEYVDTTDMVEDPQFSKKAIKEINNAFATSIYLLLDK